MNEDIHKFIRKKRRASLVKESDLSSEITLKKVENNKKSKVISPVKDSQADDSKVISPVKDSQADDSKVTIKVTSQIKDNKIKTSKVISQIKTIKEYKIKTSKVTSKDNKIKTSKLTSKGKFTLPLRDTVLSFLPIRASSVSVDLPHCLLPKKYLRLSRIFRVMTTIQKYNENRGLSNIFSKCKKSIEDILKIRLDISDIERIRYLIPEDIIIKIVEIEEKKTFTYKIKCSNEEFEKKIRGYYEKKDKRDSRKKRVNKVDEDIEDIERLRIFENEDTKKDKKKDIKKDIKKDTKIKNVKDAKKDVKKDIKKDVKKDIKNVKDAKNSDKDNKINKTDKNNTNNNKYSSILQRLKEKEKARKEEFISKAKKEDNSVFLKKVDLYLKKDGKKCVKLKEIIKVFNLYDGDRYIKKVVNEEKAYDIKEISGDEYLIKLI
ncbi:uncharacterized protein VNE69_05017 [Vairimorpha necatrix]|uniref:CDT1 Geminin-binding domain-containing protein n=1 Tax=Vairimorpha necatrix TaxID=6039 RepID=A0AAX4JBS0_9MICR